MQVAAPVPFPTTTRTSRLDLRDRAILALVCLCAGVAPLAARWIPDAVAKIAYGLFIVAALLGITFLTGKVASLRQFRELAFAFYIFALVQVLNNSIPSYVGTHVLRDPPTSGNPLASTISGSVLMQLLESGIAIVTILVLTRAAGQDLGSVYARRGVVGRSLLFAIGSFVVVCSRLPFRSGRAAPFSMCCRPMAP